ncbi:MAG: response regulator, partial [Desulfobacula sp.]|nr:response regulator [Desulfobacula sp.]
MIQKKIMIVEDEVIFGIDLIEKLENLGYQPDPNVIRYGEDVMDAAQKTKPDLILMDINLKGEMDGAQAALLVQDKNIPVIFLTAFSDRETLNNAKKAAPYAFLKKPVKLEDLKITLEIGLYKAKMEKQLKEKVLELQEALDNIKILKGLIPICSNCKNIRDDKG